MPEGRPGIPAAIRRRVRMEASDRCVVCQGTSALDLAHIVPWETVRKHEAENIVLLCAVCHRRFDTGEIDRTSMREYKSRAAENATKPSPHRPPPPVASPDSNAIIGGARNRITGGRGNFIGGGEGNRIG